jgi:predicted small integral membrane protein
MYNKKRVIKLSKAVLVLATAFFFTIVALNNVTDYNTNYQFVRHVLMMDTTFEGNQLMWRAVDSSLIHNIFYWIIIVWEIIVAVILWIAGFKLLSKKKKVIDKGMAKAIVGLTLALLLWFLAFITIGGEWFAMWQSSIWNGQNAALRMFVINGITLLYLFLKE